MVENLVYAQSTCLWITTVDGIFSILAADYFTVLPGLPRQSQKIKRWSKYEIGVAFYRNLYGPFVLNTNFWDIPSFLLELTCLLTIMRSPMSNYLTILPSLRTSLCLSLLSDTRMLNNSICLNISRYTASEWSTDFFPSKVPYLNLDGYRSIGNGNSMPIATSDRAMSVMYNGPAFQAYSENNTPFDH